MFVKPYLFGALTLLSASSALALTCVTGNNTGCSDEATAAAECESLGYSKKADKNCEHYLICPFDNDYRICVSKKCEKLGYTMDDKNWCDYDYGSTVYCPYDHSYTACTGILSYLCPDGYTDGIYYEDSDCPAGYKVDTLIFNGTECGTCIESDYECPSGYKYNLTLSDCGSGSWELVSHSSDKNCKKCQARNNCSDYTFTEKFGSGQYSYMTLQIPYLPKKDSDSLCKNGIMGKEGSKSVQCYACIPCIYEPWTNNGETKPIIDGHYDTRCVNHFYSGTKGTVTVNVDNYSNNMTSGGYKGECPNFRCLTTKDYDDMCYFDYSSECSYYEYGRGADAVHYYDIKVLRQN